MVILLDQIHRKVLIPINILTKKYSSDTKFLQCVTVSQMNLSIKCCEHFRIAHKKSPAR